MLCVYVVDESSGVNSPTDDQKTLLNSSNHTNNNIELSSESSSEGSIVLYESTL